MAANDATLPLQVFISYAREDRDMARRLYVDLKKAGVTPWFDEKNLLPGQRWKVVIPQEIRKSSYLIAVLSSHSISKEGYVQKELRIALDVVEELPPDQVFVIPVRLDDCEPQHEWLQELHRTDLFPPEQYQEGLARILEALGCAAQDEELALERTETSPQTPIISLRREPLVVSPEEAQKIFGLGNNWRPREYIANQFEDQGEVVFDHATGLLWQKSGSKNSMRYQDALKYIQELNRKQFAGYADWRLPTIPELMSLLEPEERNGDLYIDPIFDKRQRWCWSADIRQIKDESSPGSAWYVYFNDGDVYWDDLSDDDYVRAVRSRQ